MLRFNKQMKHVSVSTYEWTFPRVWSSHLLYSPLGGRPLHSWQTFPWRASEINDEAVFPFPKCWACQRLRKHGAIKQSLCVCLETRQCLRGLLKLSFRQRFLTFPLSGVKPWDLWPFVRLGLTHLPQRSAPQQSVSKVCRRVQSLIICKSVRAPDSLWGGCCTLRLYQSVGGGITAYYC